MERRVEGEKKFITIDEDEFLSISAKVCGMYCSANGGSNTLEKIVLASKFTSLFSGLSKILFNEKDHEEFKKITKELDEELEKMDSNKKEENFEPKSDYSEKEGE